QHHGCSVRDEFAEQGGQRLGMRVVDARGGFIENQQFGSRCQCTSYEHALLLSARKLSQTRMATICHVDAFERLTRGADRKSTRPTHDGTASQRTAQRDFGYRGRYTRSEERRV